ncbi:CopG family transcriptional regulator [Shewanella sp. 10N.7]|uniref:CopG family transcriptional regulator n=1 Tax=Shewanella electrodiphila TaxID=934143 RepID=A0ABT0KLL4_9GAMM|nr:MULTISPECIES: CopG family transcriptional regulator [Shewanella]MCC4834747.1 CopG family transcriptional regulator [Shewanella sp. 10N.7]MCL1044727.1 CopG family transcriptional regulator [Shewanella electrodiphila]
MGLADLKKNVTPCKAQFSPQMSVDDFIEAANLYAMGKPQRHTLSHDDSNKHAMEQLFALTEANEPLNADSSKGKPKPFRRATFTLSEAAIEQLTAMSLSSHSAKSKLIRQLIQQHFLLSEQEQRAIETDINIK